MMNILLYTNSYLPNIGGREIVVHYLAKEFQKIGHNVRVLGPAGWWKHRKLKFEYPLHRWPTLRGLFKDEIRAVTFMLDKAIWGVDIVHAHSTYPCGYTAGRVLKGKKVPMVITPHGYDIHTIPEINFGARLNPQLAPKIDQALQRAQLVTSISMSIEKSLKDAGVGEEKIRFIPNGIDIERFSQKVEGTRKWLGFDSNVPIILTVGNYHPRKGLEILIQAMPIILKTFPEAKLVIVGRTGETLKQMVAEMALNENVKLTGTIPVPLSVLNSKDSGNSTDILAGIYKEADLYVSASLNEGAEGLSLAMLDAMAAGLPLVVTNISGNKDIVSDGVNGFIVNPGEHESLAQSIIRILKDKHTACEFGAKNKLTVKNYSWKEIALKYIDLYKEVIDKQKRPCPS